MEGCYEVYYGNTAAGKVQLIRQGLYVRVICRCRLPEEAVCRLFAVHENGRENLGVVVPEGDGFVLDRKIPAKQMREDICRFVVSQGGSVKGGRIIPISPEEPFLYIDRLKNAFLETKNGKMALRIEEVPEPV